MAPFLFAAGGTILRRGMKFRAESLSALTQADGYKDQRSALAKQNWFVRLESYVDGNGQAALERKELERRAYFTTQRNMSDTDQRVAESAFRLIDSLKDEEACRIFHGTQEISASAVAEAVRA